jgi:Tfp pilus assembly protein PilO
MNRVQDISPNKVAIALGLAVLFCGAATWYLLVAPKQSKVHSLSSTIKSERSTLQKLAAGHKATQQSHRAAHKHAVSQTLLTNRALPNTTGMPQILLQLNRIATEEKVSLDSISPGLPILYSGYQAIPITITMSGSFFGVEGFLEQVRKQVGVSADGVRATGRLYDVLSVTLQNSPTPPKVSATLTLDAFTYTGIPLPTPGSTAPTTTTTSLG